MDSTRVSEALDPGSIPGKATTSATHKVPCGFLIFSPNYKVSVEEYARLKNVVHT
jgi:hypothetical protein